MTTITQPNLDHLYRMLSSDSNRETEFGELLIKIIKNPVIPVLREHLFHPNPTPNKPGQKQRLQSSRLPQEVYAKVREEWAKTIKERNLYPDSHGLSYDMFMKMLRDLYGCQDVRDPEMPITREAVNHLVHTGNPWIKSKAAVTVQDYNLQFICCFTQTYTFDELKEVGERVLKEYYRIKHSATKPSISEPIRLNLDFTPPKAPSPETIYLSHRGELTNDEKKANNLRSLLWNTLIERGKDYFLRSGISAEELLSVITEENPYVRMTTFQSLALLLDLSLDEVVKRLAKDTDNLDAGF